MKRFLLIFALCSQAWAATYYVDPQNTLGTSADTNNGTAKATAWIHAPGMNGCVSTCNSTVLNPGDHVILIGGSTVPNTYLPWVIPARSGTAGNLIYYGVDLTWFVGGSFTRPIINQGNTVSTTLVASCNVQDQHAIKALDISGSNFVQIDNLEFTGHCSSGSSVNGGYVWDGSSTHNIVSNSYFHGMTLTKAATDDSDFMLAGNPLNTNSNDEYYNNVFDNSDGTFGNACNTAACVAGVGISVTITNIVGNGTTATVTCTPNCGSIATGAGAQITGNSVGAFNALWSVTSASGSPPTSFTFLSGTNSTGTGGSVFIIGASGFAIEGNCPNVHHNVIRHVSNAIECWNMSVIHDTLIEYSFQPCCGRHGNLAEGNDGQAGNVCSYYNIVFRNTTQGVGLWPICDNAYFYNIVFENSGHFPPDTNELMLSPVVSGSAGTVHGYNLTFDSTTAMRVPGQSPFYGAGSAFTFANIHVLDRTGIFTGTALFNSCGAGNTCTTKTDLGGDIFQTTAVANGQGYVLSNDFQPTTGASTLQAGLNESSACGTGGFTSDLCSGTSNGVIEISGNGGFIVSSPAITVNARGTTFDAGAYQFQASAPPSANSQVLGGPKWSGGVVIR